MNDTEISNTDMRNDKVNVAEKEVLLILTDRWADWEAAYAASVINETPGFKVKTAAVDMLPKISIGGLRAEIDCKIGSDYNFKHTVLVIFPGGYSWAERPYPEISAFVRQAAARDIPVAAICGATIFLARNGFLDNLRHTGDDREFFENEQGYKGHEFFVEAQVVVDKGFITANETAAVEFAYEIFKMLKLDTEEEIEEWYGKFRDGMV